MPAADSRAARRVTRWHTSFTVATAVGLSAAPSASRSAADAAARLGELNEAQVSGRKATASGKAYIPVASYGGDQRRAKRIGLRERCTHVGSEQGRLQLLVDAQQQLRRDAAEVQAGDELLECLPAGVNALRVHNLVSWQPRQRGRLEASPLGVHNHVRAAQLRRLQLGDVRKLLKVRRIRSCRSTCLGVSFANAARKPHHSCVHPRTCAQND